jgi:hypothetical protein
VLDGLVGLRGWMLSMGVGVVGSVGWTQGDGLVGREGRVMGAVALVTWWEREEWFGGTETNGWSSGTEERGMVGLRGQKGMVSLVGQRGMVGLRGQKGMVGLVGQRGMVGLWG